MFKFLQDDIVGLKEGLRLSNIKCQESDNWLPLKKIEIGSAARKLCVKEQEANHMLLNDSNKKLKAAVQSNDFSCVKVVHMMLDTVNNNLKDINEKLSFVKQSLYETQKN